MVRLRQHNRISIEPNTILPNYPLVRCRSHPIPARYSANTAQVRGADGKGPHQRVNGEGKRTIQIVK